MTVDFFRGSRSQSVAPFSLSKMQNGVSTVLLVQYSHRVESESALCSFLPQ